MISRNKPIRVLHILGSMNHGGAQSFVMNIYRKIDKKKIQFDFVLHSNTKGIYDEEIKQLGGKIFHCPQYTVLNHFNYTAWWVNFFKVNNEHQIIHSHIRSTAAIYLKIANSLGLVTIAHSHSISSGHGIKAMIKNTMQYKIRFTARYLLACSKEAGDWLFGEEKTKGNNYFIINNSIESQNFIFNEERRREIRQKLGLKEEIVMGHVGRFTTEKNHLRLIEIFNDFHQKNKNSVLLLIGDGKMRLNIQNEIKKYGLKNNVILTGARSDIADFMQAMDVFVFPSMWEGLGIVVIEAQAAGLPCVIANTIPSETHITDSVISLSLNSTAKEWTDTIENLLSIHERENNMKIIKKKGYDIIDNVKWIENFYLRVINQ